MKKVIAMVLVVLSVIAFTAPCFASFGQVCYGYGDCASDAPKGTHVSTQQNNHPSTARDSLRK